jgi:hypothetical protein
MSQMKSKNPAPVVIDSHGGLGNQLFQYAIGRELELITGRPFVLDTWMHDLPGARPFELEFIYSTPTSASGYSPRLTSSLLSSGAAVTRLLVRRFHTQPGHLKETSFGFDPSILTSNNLSRLTGYFQSWRYFVNVASQLRSELIDPTMTDPWVTVTDSELSREAPWVAIHVRRGDYATARGQKRHGLLPPSYYEAAWARVIQKLPNAKPVIFSDDPHVAFELLGNVIPNVQVVIAPRAVKNIDCVRLMAMADAVITANSTFSWWGAWLGEKPGRPVLVPRQWFADSTLDHTQLVLPQWEYMP